MTKTRGWKDWFVANRTAIGEIASWDPFDAWRRNTAPEHTANDALINGAKCLFAGEVALGKQFLDQTLRVADRALEEGRVGAHSSPLFPLNRGILMRARAYAHALGGSGKPTQDFQVAAEDFRVASEGRKGDRTALQERVFYRLAAVRLFLVVGDVARASQILSLGASEYHQQEQYIWHLLVDDWSAKKEVSASTKRLLREFLEQIRPPEALFAPQERNEPVILRIDVAAIVNRYVKRRGEIVEWRAVARLE